MGVGRRSAKPTHVSATKAEPAETNRTHGVETLEGWFNGGGFTLPHTLKNNIPVTRATQKITDRPGFPKKSIPSVRLLDRRPFGGEFSGFPEQLAPGGLFRLGQTRPAVFP